MNVNTKKFDSAMENDAEKEYMAEMSDIADRESSNSYEEGETHELLAGYEDENGTVHKTFTLREMTGEDEEYINRTDIKSNGAKVSTALLSRCVTSIGNLTKKSVGPQNWNKIFQNILVGDRDIMLLELRKQSLGNEIEVVHTCPNPECKAKLKTIIEVDELEITPYNGIKEIPFELPKGYTDSKGVLHKSGKMRRPNGLDGEVLTPVAKNNIAKAESLLLSRICQFDDGAFIDQSIMAKLSLKDRKYLQELLHENTFGVEMTVPVMCDRCGEEFRGTLNQSNFI